MTRSIIDYSGNAAAYVDVQCHITNGLPAVIIIGYASKAVDEAKERLRASFANCAIQLPKKRVTLNLSPADVPKKDATSLDLAMAVAILAQSKQIETPGLDKMVFLGELSLDGSLNAIRGLIGRLLFAKDKAATTFYVPQANLDQALLVPGLTLKPAANLRDVYLDLSGTLKLKSVKTGRGRVTRPAIRPEIIDFSEIAGQPIAKRALEIAAAGHHNILLHGPPGTGKTMLARAMCGILPDLEHSEVLEITHLHSLGNGFTDIISSRPFRAPHHTASTMALVGGGQNPKPGEASLAHRGVLFLDELPEFSHGALEALRQPLEDGTVTVARVKDSATYPADFILVATQNPCPCGFYGTDKPCVCSPGNVSRYQKKISGPITDRIDLHLSVHEVDHKRLLEKRKTAGETTAIKQRVGAAFDRQQARFGGPRFNGSMTNKEIREKAALAIDSKQLLDSAASKLGLSARAYVRTVKVARTIADLAGSINVEPAHVAEALQYRAQPAPL